MTNEQTLAALTGIIISLLTSYVPKFNTWFAALDNTAKRLLMLGALLVSSLAMFGASCIDLQLPFLARVACNATGGKELLGLFIFSAIANQTALPLSPKAPEVQKVLIAQVKKQDPDKVI